MNRRENLLAKIRNNPRGVKFRDLTKVLEWHGFELRKVTGSHHIYKRSPKRYRYPGTESKFIATSSRRFSERLTSYRRTVERETMEKTVDYYLSLPYTVELRQDPEEGWFVSVRELPGCMSQGDTAAKAVEMIRDAMMGWIEVALEDGDPVPEPRLLEDYSGKFVVRVPRSLHRELVEEAMREGASLNKYINVALARSVGWTGPKPYERLDQVEIAG